MSSTSCSRVTCQQSSFGRKSIDSRSPASRSNTTPRFVSQKWQRTMRDMERRIVTGRTRTGSRPKRRVQDPEGARLNLGARTLRASVRVPRLHTNGGRSLLIRRRPTVAFSRRPRAFPDGAETSALLAPGNKGEHKERFRRLFIRNDARDPVARIGSEGSALGRTAASRARLRLLTGKAERPSALPTP
jgi:hypothetical protein